MALRIALALSLLGLALAGCGTSPQAPVDGGNDAWARPDAPLGPDSCDPDHLHVLMGVEGGTVGIDFDTTMTMTRPRDLGLGCGNPAPDIRWAPQEVVEFHVPGTGMQGVQFSTSNSMTAMNFNTVLQVRTGDCRTIPTAAFTCFDDEGSDLEAQGGITVMGGSTIYVFVTGYSDPPAGQMAVDHGMVHVDFAVAPNTPPVINSGTTLFSGTNVINTLNVTDNESTLLFYSFRMFIGAQVVDVNGDGMGDASDALFQNFQSIDATPPTYVTHSTFAADGMTYYALVDFCHTNHCTQWGYTVYDTTYTPSAEVRIDVHDANVVGLGQSCDTMHVCATGLDCTSGSCVASAAAAAACLGANELTIATPTTAATTAMVGGSIGAGSGTFSGSCGMTGGHESIWHLAVPAGDFDLALTTDVGGATSDTVLYVRHACPDASSELPMGCNDDISMTNLRSALGFRDLAAGDYYIFVEGYGTGGGATSFHLQATLTPVLASGATCDPSMSNYRCASGSCSATTMTCP